MLYPSSLNLLGDWLLPAIFRSAQFSTYLDGGVYRTFSWSPETCKHAAIIAEANVLSGQRNVHVTVAECCGLHTLEKRHVVTMTDSSNRWHL